MEWVTVFNNLRDSLLDMFDKLADDKDADVSVDIEHIYNQVFSIVYRLKVLELKNIPIIPSKDVRKIKVYRDKGLATIDGSELVQAIYNTLFLLGNIDSEAEEVIISLL